MSGVFAAAVGSAGTGTPPIELMLTVGVIGGKPTIGSATPLTLGTGNAFPAY
jgi:hypothetical protein